MVVVVPPGGPPEFIPLGASSVGIVDVIKDAAERHPGCRVRLFMREENRKFFKGLVPLENVYWLPWRKPAAAGFFYLGQERESARQDVAAAVQMTNVPGAVGIEVPLDRAAQLAQLASQKAVHFGRAVQ